MRFQPTASLAALAPRRLMRGPLARTFKYFRQEHRDAKIDALIDLVCGSDNCCLLFSNCPNTKYSIFSSRHNTKYSLFSDLLSLPFYHITNLLACKLLFCMLAFARSTPIYG